MDGPHKGEKGEFPSNYVKLCEDEPEVKGKNRKRKRKGEEGGQSSEDRGGLFSNFFSLFNFSPPCLIFVFFSDEYVVALFACEAEVLNNHIIINIIPHSQTLLIPHSQTF